MFSRIMLRELGILSKQFRVVTVLGPRQAGKSTLCRTAFPDYRYVSLEDPDQRAFAKEDPKAFLNQYDNQVIFDEIQASSSYSSGYALRFPRILRVRFDKGVGDISTLKEIEHFYREQK